MSDQNTAATLTIEDHFSVEEMKVSEPFSHAELTTFSVSAIETLKAIITLEQVHRDYQDPDSNGFSSELQRIEQKIDFITELLIKSLQSQQQIVAKTAVKLSAKTLVWQSRKDFAKGDLCLLNIHLSQKYPMPVSVPIQVLNPSASIDSEMAIEGSILFADEEVTDTLTQLIFLNHRRQIARQRS